MEATILSEGLMKSSTESLESFERKIPMSLPIDKFQKLETPFYYYDMQLLIDTLRKIEAATCNHPHFHVHYALKANVHPGLLRIIASHGFGADCVSGGEVDCAIAHGFDSNKVVFAGVGKSDKEIMLALQRDIACFNVESIPELENIANLAAKMGKVANVAFRINPNVDAHTHEKITTGLHENKFGIAPEQLPYVINLVIKNPSLSYEGLHFHIGSQITDMEPYRQLCQRINEIQDFLDSHCINTRSINVGGGLGVDYNYPHQHPIPNFDEYFATFSNFLRLRPGQQVHFELGRSIVAQCGILVARVLYVKDGLTKHFAILDAGMTDLIRPAMYGALHQLVNLTSNSDVVQHYDVVGPVCESSDTFATNYKMSKVHRGDLIALLTAGAYGETMASRYNLRDLPKSYISKDI